MNQLALVSVTRVQTGFAAFMEEKEDMFLSGSVQQGNTEEGKKRNSLCLMAIHP